MIDFSEVFDGDRDCEYDDLESASVGSHESSKHED